MRCKRYSRQGHTVLWRRCRRAGAAASAVGAPPRRRGHTGARPPGAADADTSTQKSPQIALVQNRVRSVDSDGYNTGQDGSRRTMADEVTWVQCEACDKWRRVPHLTPDRVPDRVLQHEPDPRDSCGVRRRTRTRRRRWCCRRGSSRWRCPRAAGPARKRWYRVRWKGFGDRPDTWEDERNIMHPGCARPAPPSAACGAALQPTHPRARPRPAPRARPA